MEIALGVLGWTPPVFWSATPREFWSAWTGWRRANTSDTEGEGSGGRGMSVNEFLDIREILDAEKGKVYRPGEGQVITPHEFRRKLNG